MNKDIQLYQISENDLEKCLKCSICNAYCPVSDATPLYPGPKWAGPDGERHRMKDASYYDDHTMKMCLNCKRCEVVCPQGVKVGDIIQSARIKYGLQGIDLRGLMLASTDLMGSIATHSMGLANWATSTRLGKEVLHNVVGIHRGRTLPRYASQTFEAWYNREAREQQQKFEHRVAYFHGCYVNYNYPKLGQQLVRVMNALGFGVDLIVGEKCCGLPAIANGMSEKAQKNGRHNLQAMEKALQTAETILTTSSSCTFTMRSEYASLLNLDNAKVADALTIATKFIYQQVKSGKAQLRFRPDFHLRVAYHSACHMERLGWTIYSIELLKMIPGLELIRLDSRCCGIGGTYGFKKENYEVSQTIGAPLFEQINEVKPDVVVTDCETCKWQIEMNTPFEVMNPITIINNSLLI